MKTFFHFLLATVFVFSLHAQQKYKPELNLTVGETYYHTYGSKMTMTQPINNQILDVVIDFKIKTSFKVLEIIDSVYKMEVEYTGIHFKSIPHEGDILEYNSEWVVMEKQDPSIELYYTALHNMLNQKFMVYIAKSGQVVGVEGLEEIQTSAIEKLPNYKGVERKVTSDQLEMLYGKLSLKGYFEMGMLVFPPKPVLIGEKWNVKSAQRSLVPMLTNSTYEISKVDASKYYIKGNAKGTIDYKYIITEAADYYFKYDIAGDIVSEIEIDKKTGWVENAKINQHLSGKAYAGSTKQDIPMTIKNSISISK